MLDDPVSRSLRDAADEALAAARRISVDQVLADGLHRRVRSVRRKRRAAAAAIVVALTAAVVVPLPRWHLLWRNGPGPSRPAPTTASVRWTVTSLGGPAYRFHHPTDVVTSGDDVFVADARSITELDARDGAIVRTFSGARDHFGRVTALVVAGKALFVPSGRDALSELSTVTGRHARTLRGAYGFSAPAGGVFDGRHLWFSNEASNSVVEVDPSSGAVVAVIRAARFGLDVPDAMALAGHDLWVTDAGGAGLTEIDTQTGGLVRVVRGSRYGFVTPISIAFDGSHLWVVNYYEGDSVTEVSARNGALIRVLPARRLHVRIPFSVAAHAGDVWLAADAPTSAPSSAVAEIDAFSGRVVHVFDRPAGAFKEVFGVAAASAGTVFVTCPSSNSVTEISRTGSG